jgi:hypothetical protein
MYCDYYEEYVNQCNCIDCSRVENCSQLKKESQQQIASLEKIKHLKDEEIYKTMVTGFAKFTGLETSDAETMAASAFSKALEKIEFSINTSLQFFAEKQAMEYFEAKTDKMLDDLFQKVIEERVLSITSDSKANITTIQAVVSERVKKYFDNKDKSNNRNKVSDCMTSAITKIVNQKVDESLKEITEEAIEKFNKETMKTMMMGMAKAIQDNPKLLSILSANQD